MVTDPLTKVTIFEILASRVIALADYPLDQFKGLVDLQQREIRIGTTVVGTIISLNAPMTKQIALRIMAINGFEYRGVMRRRPNHAPSYVTFKLVSRLHDAKETVHE